MPSLTCGMFLKFGWVWMSFYSSMFTVWRFHLIWSDHWEKSGLVLKEHGQKCLEWVEWYVLFSQFWCFACTSLQNHTSNLTLSYPVLKHSRAAGFKLAREATLKLEGNYPIVPLLTIHFYLIYILVMNQSFKYGNEINFKSSGKSLILAFLYT